MDLGIIATENVFDDKLIGSLIKILPTDVRKVRWFLSEAAIYPSVLNEAREPILSKIPSVQKINIAIRKIYRIGEDSRAYMLHTDPVEFHTQPLLFITLSGKAEMEI